MLREFRAASLVLLGIAAAVSLQSCAPTRELVQPKNQISIPQSFPPIADQVHAASKACITDPEFIQPLLEQPHVQFTGRLVSKENGYYAVMQSANGMSYTIGGIELETMWRQNRDNMVLSRGSSECPAFYAAGSAAWLAYNAINAAAKGDFSPVLPVFSPDTTPAEPQYIPR